MYSIFAKETEDLYIYLGIINDTDINLPRFRVQSMTFVEEFGTLSPVLNVKFVDQTGFSIYYEPILPNYTFVVHIGKSRSDYFELKMKMADISYASNDISDNMNVLVSIDLITDHWEDIYKVQKSRSFNNKLYSDILLQLSNEIGFTSVDIQKTAFQNNVVQPYWTNARFIDWMAAHSQSVDRKHGFVFFVDREDKFVFKNYPEFYNQESVVDLQHSGVITADEEDRFSMPTITNQYLPHLKYGGFGLTHAAFDYNNKTFIREVISPDVKNDHKLSNYHMLVTDHVSAEMFNYSGRDINTSKSKNLLSSAGNNTQFLTIYLRARTDINLGDVVNVVMPVARDNDTQDVTNHMYGGKWLVVKMVHQVNVPQKDYTIICHLSRNGINIPPTTDEIPLLKAR